MKSDQYAARLAGFMFLFLMATVISGSILLSGVEGNNEISDTLRNISETHSE
jgi:succinate dehydrogenase/fumarate reductase cytochrome b subunit